MFSLAGIIGLIATVNWKFLIPSVILIGSLIILRFLYIPTARSLKRLEAASKLLYRFYFNIVFTSYVFDIINPNLIKQCKKVISKIRIN